MEIDKKIENLIKRARKRLCFIKFIKGLLLFVIIGLALWGLMQLISLIVPFYSATLVGILLCMASILIGVIITVIRYPSMKDDYRDFLDALRKSPLMGEPLGKHLRKVRFPIASKAKGKSGGARVITHTVLIESNGADITLATIYDKSDQASIPNRELRKLMKKNGLE